MMLEYPFFDLTNVLSGGSITVFDERKRLRLMYPSALHALHKVLLI